MRHLVYRLDRHLTISERTTITRRVWHDNVTTEQQVVLMNLGDRLTGVEGKLLFVREHVASSLTENSI